MITGFSAPDFPFAKIPTEEIARKMLGQYPQFSNILRTTGEGSQDFDFYNSADRAYIDGFLNLAKYLDVPVIVVLNDYWSLMYQKYGATYKDKAEIARKSNLAIVNEVIRQNVRVHSFAICNEIFAKNELIGWSTNLLGKPDWSRNTVANIDAMNKAADAYAELVGQYHAEISGIYYPAQKIALPMGTDLNLARKTWDTAIFSRMNKYFHVLDAHLYPSRNLTGTALADLIKKRLGRGYGTGAEIIIGEMNVDFGMYGTGTVPTYEENGIKKPYPRSTQHLKDLNSIIGEVEKYATVACVHKLGGLNKNNYDMIDFTL